MPKRDSSENTDSLSDDSSADEPLPKKSKTKEKAAAKEVKEPSPKKKKKKPKREKSESESSEGVEDEEFSSRGLEPGAYWLEEKRMRRIQVRQFKGMPLIDIREMYMGANGMAPGKKGISLNVAEWRQLVKLVKKVDEELMKIT